MKIQRLFLAFAIIAASLALPSPVRAQSPFQAGAQLATIRVGDSATTNTGFGGRASFDLNHWFSAEAELNLTPRDRFAIELLPIASTGGQIIHHRRRLEGFFGPKIGLRRQRYGLFGTIKPGFARLDLRGLECTGPSCPLILIARPEYRTEFAVAFGGIFEVYPTGRTVARIDVGDTWIRHRSIGAPPCSRCSTHNLATRLGVGFRF